jgi:hypothetical protein
MDGGPRPLRQKTGDTIWKTNEKDEGHGLSDKALAQESWDPEFNHQYHQKNEKKIGVIPAGTD